MFRSVSSCRCGKSSNVTRAYALLVPHNINAFVTDEMHHMSF